MPDRPPLDMPRHLVAGVADYLARLEPEHVTGSEAADLYKLFAELTRLGTAGQTLLARRVAESDTWHTEGHRSPASWMARTTGTGLGHAIATLETAKRLESLPRTADALRSGALSAPQVREIASAATTRPSAEEELLAVATSCAMKELKDHARRVRSLAGSAAAEKERHDSLHRGRFFRHWSDADGALRGEFKLAPDEGARLVSSIGHRADELFDEASRAGRRVSRPACEADALVDLGAGRASGDMLRGGGSYIVHIRVDAAALRRGYAEDGEVCEIPGVGPVPVATARAVLPEAFLELLVTDGVDLVTVCRVGEGVPAHVRSAIEQRDPRCVVPGCNVAIGLELARWEGPDAGGGSIPPTALARLCPYHYVMKTDGRFRLRGGPGKWEWEPPPEPETG